MASDNSNGLKFYNAHPGIFAFVVFLACIRKITGVEKLIFLQSRLIGAQSFQVCCQFTVASVAGGSKAFCNNMARRKKDVPGLPYTASPLSCVAFFVKEHTGLLRIDTKRKRG